MNYLFERLTPLIKDVSDKGKVYCDTLTQEMADQAETIRKAGYDLKGLTQQDITCIEAFTKVYNTMCVAIIAVENGKKKAVIKNGERKVIDDGKKKFKEAANSFELRFNTYAKNLQNNLDGEKYNMLVKEVCKKIKKPAVSESNFPSVSQLSPSYSAALLAD